MKNNNLTTIILMLSTCILLNACASKHKTTFLRTESYYDDNKKILVDFDLSKNNIYKNDLTLSITEKYSVPEYNVDIIEEKHRQVESPSIIGIINLFNPASYLLALAFDDMDFIYSSHKPPFGKIGDWYSSEKRTNTRQTGATKIETVKAIKSYEITASIESKNLIRDEYLKSETQTTSKFEVSSLAFNGSAKINLSEVKNLPEKPQKLEINISATNKEKTKNLYLEVTDYELSTMALNNPLWAQNDYERSLPIDQRKKYYSEQLLVNMKSAKFKSALEWFEKLEKMNIELPESFPFHYGVALAKTGKSAEAKNHLTDYLKAAPPTSRYAKRAQALLEQI